MKIIGIIAEYNPFHNGHAYQIKKAKEELQADYVVVAMSGNFVQRGAPAIIDKYTRAKMALSCGADLVIELPVLWATASAEYFAMAGVTLFDKMGCVDSLCFGAETDDLATLSMLADILVDEPEEYRVMLSSYLKEGLVFPIARSKALCAYFKSSMDSATNSGKNVSISNHVTDFEKISSILSTPNNILAIEYLKALKRRNSVIKPYVIKREGAGYHDTEIASQTTHYGAESIPTASATAIRKELSNGFLCDSLSSAMPDEAFNILAEYASDNPLIEANDFSSIFGYQLLAATAETLTDIGDSNPDIANRIIKNRMQFSSFETFCELCKSKDVTYSRINRVLLHLVLKITNQDYEQGKVLDYISYLRILGFRKDASALLKKAKASAQIPLIAKLADASTILTSDAMAVLDKDIFAGNLYTQICAIKKGAISRNEFTQEIVRI